MNKIIKNEIKSINSKDLNLLKSKLSRDNKVLVVELDGNKTQSWMDYVTEIQSKFSFPTPCADSVDRYLDWIRDLEWLEQEKFVIIINHFSDFCKKNPSIKNEIMQDFEEIILPFWQNEVREEVAGGEPRSFIVYIVD
ncbi:barstar family protein [Sporomusa sphaeroides]|uniref:barstar family protein n=1 Tax=Sporomusa sphaeroides TaxID=47679 RepID=UPI002BB09787|nr:barstar family protein [Sporomusa sphaeroides]HML35038.1 barstar family protein [Sporomusa sphaeroides]